MNLSSFFDSIAFSQRLIANCILVIASISITSCLGSKFLQDNEQLLVKNEVKGLNGSLKDHANNLIEQKPNSRPFGVMSGTPLSFMVMPFSHLAHTYQAGKNGTLFTRPFSPEHIIEERERSNRKFESRISRSHAEKKTKRLRKKKASREDKYNRVLKEGNQLMRWGEELSVYDHQKSINSADKIQQALNSKGYFNSQVEVDTLVLNASRKTLQSNYVVKKGHRFFIDSIQFSVADSVLARLIMDKQKKSPLKKGGYDQAMLTLERDYIYDLAVNNGYFAFSKQYVSFEVDSSSLPGDALFVKVIVRNPPNEPHHKIFYLDDIVFRSDASLRGNHERTTSHYKDIKYDFGKNIYSRKVLNWRIPLEKGDFYRRDLTIETQKQLSYLENFKFVNINYDTTGNKFTANIFTSSLNKFQTSTEAGIIQNTNSQRLAPFFNFNLKNRNTFRALEITSIDANIKLEGINSVTGETNENYSSRQYGTELSFTFPQFLFPLGRFYKKSMSRFNPKTRMSFGLGYEDRVDEYIRRTVRMQFSYLWQVKNHTKYTLTPLQTSFIDSDNTAAFEQFLNGLESDGNTYANSFRSAFVNSSSFQLDLTLGGYGQGEDGSFLSFFGEVGGSMNNLFGDRAISRDIETYRFVKASADYRKIERITSRLNIAYRLNIGIAYASGDNNALPYEKYFFGGGSNSLRAWKPRRLGPGAFGIIDSNGEVDFTREQPGDLIIESSFELRPKLVGFLEGAFFIDAGNIWLVRGTSVDPSQDPEGDDGKFQIDSFLSETAVGTGLGLRFDLSFLILRLDLGLKLVDPARAKGKRFVGNEIFSNFSSNSEINIGIGYPF